MNSLRDLWRRRRWRARASDQGQRQATRPATIITGGSAGIGLELARQFAKQRAVIVLIARDPAGLARATAQIEGSAEIITLALDITQPQAADALLAALAEHRLHAHELVNNAGIGLSGRFLDAAAADVAHLLDLNITALTRLTHAVLPAMVERGSGGIINIASLGGLTPGPYQAAYYASKAYVVSLTRALAHEYRGMGVTITCVLPGPVETAFHAKMDAEHAFYRRFLPSFTAANVAKSTIFWYGTGRVLIVPGTLNLALSVALGFLPGFLIIPVIAFLLNPGDPSRDV